MEIAKTILEQMGGINRLSVMIGAHNFVADEKSVMFSFKGSRKYNKIRVTLDPTDTYTVEIMKYSPSKLAITKTDSTEGVYCDMLKSLIEDKTGLYLSI